MRVTILRYLVLFGVLTILIAGCAAPVELPLEPFKEPEKVCRNVTQEIPVAHAECTNISYTEEVCERKKLEYTSALAPVVHLCVADGECVGSPLSECPFCPRAMTRCKMTITNNDDTKSGSWTVGAKYTLGTSGFDKDPITYVIAPGETATFDFHQMYVPGYPVNSASCELYIISEPIVDVCHQETRLKRDCVNVTTYVSVEREVCE